MRPIRTEIRQTFTSKDDAELFLAKCMSRRDCNMYPLQRREYQNHMTSKLVTYYEVYGIRYNIEITDLTN